MSDLVLVPHPLAMPEWTGRPVNLSADAEDSHIGVPTWDVKAYRRSQSQAKAIKSIVKRYRNDIAWCAKVMLMKGYLGLPRERKSDWLTAPCYYVLTEFIYAIHRRSEKAKALADKRKKEQRDARSVVLPIALENEPSCSSLEPHPVAGVVCVPAKSCKYGCPPRLAGCLKCIDDMIEADRKADLAAPVIDLT